jgi:ABC-type glutathione transport system ATPase component
MTRPIGPEHAAPAATPVATAPVVTALRPPDDAARLLNRLKHCRDDRVGESQKLAQRFGELNQYLEIADQVTAALEALSDKLFDQILGIVREKLSIALQEILDQPIELKAEAGFARNSATVSFSIVRDGNEENVLGGQGGSVANILSVGLRIFALNELSPERHRRFLLLDEQDCWLRPDLVPRLVKIIAEAGRELGFQVLMISHHDVDSFAQYADRIYEFAPHPDGVRVQERCLAAPEAD